MLTSCTFPSDGGARIATTIGVPPDVGPELTEVPIGDLNVVMQPGHATQDEVDSALEGLSGYVAGSGALQATYIGERRIDIYHFTVVEGGVGVGPEGPMTCTAEVEFGRPVEGWGCTGGVQEDALDFGIAGMGLSTSDRGDYTMTVEVGPAVETVVIETSSEYTIVIVPAAGIAYAEWRNHRPVRVTVFSSDGNTGSELVWQ
jgi:hypothetical protein